MEVLAKGPLLDWTNDGKLHQEEGFNFMQRPCNEQVRSRVCLFMSLSVVGRAWAEHFRQGNVFDRQSQEVGEASRKS